jgi:hypothetical protein
VLKAAKPHLEKRLAKFREELKAHQEKVEKQLQGQLNESRKQIVDYSRPITVGCEACKRTVSSSRRVPLHSSKCSSRPAKGIGGAAASFDAASLASATLSNDQNSDLRAPQIMRCSRALGLGATASSG